MTQIAPRRSGGQGRSWVEDTHDWSKTVRCFRAQLSRTLIRRDLPQKLVHSRCEPHRVDEEAASDHGFLGQLFSQNWS
jgi:hypothetical protein